MLAITLERNSDDMQTVDEVRQIFQELLMSSAKLDLIPISESLQDTLTGLDLLLDWQVYPVAMSEFMLILIDKILIVAYEIEEKHFIDIRKTQQILVALQSIILAKSIEQMTSGIDEAIASISQDIPSTEAVETGAGDALLFDDGIDLFGDDGVDLFDDPEETTTSAETSSPEGAINVDIFVPEASRNPIKQAQEFIKGHSDENRIILLGQISDQASQHSSSHTQFLLELTLAVNLMAGEPLDMESIHKGICLHDIALASLSDLLTSKSKLTDEQIEMLKQHPVNGADVVRKLGCSEDASLLVLHHHECIDGSGYPFGLKGDDISEQGKLAAIVDSFHSVIESCNEPAEKLCVMKAITEINSHVGTKYDAAWVAMFNQCIRNYWLEEWSNTTSKKVRHIG